MRKWENQFKRSNLIKAFTLKQCLGVCTCVSCVYILVWCKALDVRVCVAIGASGGLMTHLALEHKAIRSWSLILDDGSFDLVV